MDLDRIDVLGTESLEEERVPFKVRCLSSVLTKVTPRFLVRWIYGRLQAATRVEFLSDKCVKCGNCATVCPAGVIELSPYPAIVRKGCITCLCCQELCPHGAIETRLSLIGEDYRGVCDEVGAFGASPWSLVRAPRSGTASPFRLDLPGRRRKRRRSGIKATHSDLADGACGVPGEEA